MPGSPNSVHPTRWAVVSRFRSVFAAALLGLTVVTTGCAEQNADRDFVQPNVVSKSLFNGEWYHRTTVVDVPIHVNQTFIGSESSMDRIRWEIQEKYLIARKAYEAIPETDNVDGKSNYAGAVVAMFEIKSHFDVQRQYNPATGEEQNVIVENTTDRPWYERTYFRVDWTTNLAASDVYQFQISSTGSPVSPLSYQIQGDGVDTPYAPVVTKDYMDFTTVDVLGTNSGEIGGLYNCLILTGGYNIDCGVGEVVRRTSFRKIGENESDYQRYEYPDNTRLTYKNEQGVETRVRQRYDSNISGYRPCTSKDPYDECSDVTMPVFERFGFFRTQRTTYDRNRGQTETGLQNTISRWNIWKKSYNTDGTEIPFKDREIKPVVYYMNAEYPEDIKPAGLEIGDEWNRVFVGAYQSMTGKTDSPRIFEVRENSCNVKNIAAYTAKYPDAQAALSKYGIGSSIDSSNMVRACSVLENTTRNSKEPFTWEKLGDLRYTFMNVIHKPTQAPWFGFGPSSPDPVTGEIIAANANVNGDQLNVYSTYAADIVDAVNGKLPINDIITGDYVVKQMKTQQNLRAERQAELAVPGSSKTFMETMEKRFARLPEMNARNRPLNAGGAPLSDASQLSKIAGTNLEKLLVTDEIAASMGGGVQSGFQRGDTVTADLLARANPAEWSAEQRTAFYYDRLKALLNHRNSCVMLSEFVDSSVIGLALKLKDKPREEVIKTVKNAIYKGVMLHEIGHTVGLRHNFEGSFDALNYFDGYWDIRVEMDAKKASLEASLKAQSLVEGSPAWKDAYAKGYAEILQFAAEKSKTEHQYSTIMDYGAKFNSDVLGLGKYDQAAIKFGYGGMIEMWDPLKVDTAKLTQYDPGAFEFSYTNDDFVGRLVNSEIKDRHEADPSVPLSDSFKFANQAAALKARIDVPHTQFVNDIRLSYLDQISKLGDKLSPEDEAAVAGFRAQVQAGKDLDFKAREAARKASPQERGPTVQKLLLAGCDNVNGCLNRPVPYRFNSDEYSNGYPTNNLWDEGESFSEIAAAATEAYHNYYFFNSYKRDRVGFGLFGPDFLIGRLQQRYFDFMIRSYLYSYIYRVYVYGQQYEEQFLRDQVSFYKDLSIAGCSGFNTMAEVLSTPEPGDYCYAPKRQCLARYGALPGGKNCEAPYTPVAGAPANTNCRPNIRQFIFYDPEEGRPAECIPDEATDPGYDAAEYEAYPDKENLFGGRYIRRYDFDVIDRDNYDKGLELSNSSTLRCAPLARPEAAKHPDMSIPIGVGKFNTSSFTQQYSYNWDRVGSFYDKLAALQGLAASQNRFFRVDEFANIGTYTINFYRLFPTETVEIVRGMLLDRVNFLASTWSQKDGYHAPVVCDFNSKDPNLPTSNQEDPTRTPIDTNITYTLRYYAMLYGFGLMSNPQDDVIGFDRYAKVGLKGWNDDFYVEPVGGVSVYEWTEPMTGRVYRAPQTRDQRSISVDLLKDAKRYEDDFWQPRYKEWKFWEGALAYLDDKTAALANYPDLQAEATKRNLNLDTLTAADRATLEDNRSFSEASWNSSQLFLNSKVETLDILREFNRVFSP
jgi:hypothetical protein